MTKILESDFVPIIGHGSIASGAVADGRFIPVIIYDSEKRDDIYDIIIHQKNQPPGDVVSTWARKRFHIELLNDYMIFLLLEFKRPTLGRVAFEFNVMTHHDLIDDIIYANALQLQPSSHGLKVVDGCDKMNIVVEIPSNSLPFKWEAIYRNAIFKKARKSGLPRSDAKIVAEEFIKKRRKTFRSRELWK